LSSIFRERASGIKHTESYSLMTSSSRSFAMKLYRPLGVALTG
jgi:hypothetical protein